MPTALLANERPRRETLWVVEDSELEAEMARRVLAPRYDVELFADGLLVLERLASGPPPDVLLLDALLPDTTGPDLCRAVRERFDEISLPILFLTSQSRSEDIVFGLEAGANDYMTKPYQAAELGARVAALARVGRLHRRVKQLERDAREREAHYRDVVAALDEGIIVRSRDGVVLSANPAAEAILCVRRDELLGRPLSDSRWEPVDRQGAPLDEHPPAAALRTGAPQRNVLMGVRRADGVRIWLSVNANPLTRPDTGEVSGVVTSFFDVTEQRRVERERDELYAREREARALAEAANRSKDEFLATTSHELRTPLNAVLGWTRLLRDGDLAPAARDRALATIERNALAQVQLVEDLLDVSRVVSGKLRLEVGALDLADVVREAAETVRPAAEAKGVALGLHLGPPAPITGDVDRLRQVVWNLLANAVKFTPRGGRVDVRIERNGAATQLVVRDDGQGVSADFLPYVFDRFRQADGSSSRRHGGLGLGLSLVRSLVELHGGTVRAESEGEGRGSTFTVTLPVRAVYAAKADDEAAGPGAPGSLPPGSDAPPARLDGVRVLVVDDEADALDLLATVLRLQGAVLVQASSAEEALAALERERPDVLLSDIGMPIVDGYELIRRVRALPPERGGAVRAAAVTAYDRRADRQRALAAGFELYIGKPVDPAALVALVARLARRG